MVWIIGGLLVIVAATVGGLVYAVHSLQRWHKDFYSFASQCNDYLQRSNTDLADKVLSHSDKFLELKHIERETEPGAPQAPRKTVVRAYEDGAEGPSYGPQGEFVR